MTQSLGSIALAAAGVGLAASATAFAFHMVSDRGRTPTFSGAEHLRIFAQPASREYGKLQARRSSETLPALLDADDMPVGSIEPTGAGSEAGSPGGSTGDGTHNGQRRTEMPVRGVFNGKALIEVPNGFDLVEPGSALPSLGRILAIEPRDGKWVVVTAHGVASADR